MSDRGDEEEHEGLRILGTDPDGAVDDAAAADDAAGADDDLPHWSDSPGEGSSWAGSDPQWGDSWEDDGGTPHIDDVGAGSAAAVGGFNPSLLPPTEYDDGVGYDPTQTAGGSAYADDPAQFGAVPAVAADGAVPAGMTDYDDSTPPAAPAPSGGRDLPTAVGVGVGLAALALLAFAIGKLAALVLVAAVLGAAAVEWFFNLRQRGYQPATLLGISACVALPLATYWRGTEAIPLVLFLSIVVGSLWYLTGVGTERPVPNLGVTLYGIIYIGVLGSFAGLLLKFPNGIGMLLAAIIVTAAYDIGGYFIGSTMGRSAVSEASPNKTIEGLLGGGVVAIIAAVIVLNVIGLTPFGQAPGGFVEALSLGVATAFFAPLGDLSESLLKRDLEVKDMGTMLPGHGGLLDRFDSLLFMLPVTYYLVALFDLF